MVSNIKFATLGSTSFFATDVALYKTDGSLDGTQLLMYGSFDSLAVMGGRLYFAGYDSSNGTGGVWVYDNATGVAASFMPGAYGVAASGNALFFYYGMDLWASDGTVEGSHLVMAWFTSTYLGACGNTAFFSAFDSDHGWELWKSDGTPEGTQLVKDILPGPDSSGIPSQSAVAMNDVLYFTAYDGGRTGLWRTDGTEAGTYLVTDSTIPQADVSPIVFGDHIYFLDGSGRNGLWKSDGSAEGTVLVKDFIVFDSLVVLGNTLYFTDHQHLWRSDGTEAGTYPFDDYPNGVAGLAAGQTQLFFVANTPDSGNTDQLWRSDGTDSGAVMLTQMGGYNFNADNIAIATLPDGTALFRGWDAEHGWELWKTNGSQGSTSLLMDLASGTTDGLPMQTGVTAAVIGTTAYFSSGGNLWKSDGTEGGTGSMPLPEGTRADWTELASASDCAYFLSVDWNRSWILWKSDGTEGGSGVVATGDLPSWRWCYIDVVVGNALYFTIGGYGVPWELWTSDGTREGTRLVKTFELAPQRFTALGDKLLFAGYDPMHGFEPWISVQARPPPRRSSAEPVPA